MQEIRRVFADPLAIRSRKIDNDVGATDVSDKNVGPAGQKPGNAALRSNKNVALEAQVDRNVSSETRRLSTLLEVSQALSGTLNLKASLHRVLEILAHHHGAVRGIVSLLHPAGDLRVQASDALGAPSPPVPHQLADGITAHRVH